jgi:hypothetical protein
LALPDETVELAAARYRYCPSSREAEVVDEAAAVEGAIAGALPSS